MLVSMERIIETAVDPGEAPHRGPSADVSAAIRIVSAGLARSVTIAGLSDAGVAAASGSAAAARAGVSLETIPPRRPGDPASALRVRRLVAQPAPRAADRRNLLRRFVTRSIRAT